MDDLKNGMMEIWGGVELGDKNMEGGAGDDL